MAYSNLPEARERRPTLTALDYGDLRISMAAFEVFAYLVIVAAGSPDFLAGWLTVNEAVVLTIGPTSISRRPGSERSG